MEKLRKAITISVMMMTVLSMTMLAVPMQVGAAASAGDLIKMDGLSSVYYLGGDGKRYVFPNEQTYFSWYSDFSSVVTVPQSELESYPLGANVTIRPGTKLVKITTDPKVYAVEPNGVLKHVPDEATAATLFGANWNKRILDVPDAFFTNYTVSASQVAATAYPIGSLVKFSGSADVYYIAADGSARKVASEAAFEANRFKWSDVIDATIVMPTAGTDVAAAESDLTDTSSGAGGVAGAGTGLTVALASDTPAAATIIDDSTNANGSQAMVPMAKIKFTAAADGAVKVKNIALKRGGVSADSDVANYYLYDGDTYLMQSTSVTTGVVTFTNNSGIFTVDAGATKTITLKVDIADAASSGATINYSIVAASDITTDGAAVSGSFPIAGNSMSVAVVANKLGYVTVANVAPAAASTVDPGQTDYEVWKFSLTTANQNMEIRKLRITNIGSVNTADLSNFKLMVGGTQIGSTIASMDSGGILDFDLSSSPYTIDSGLVKNVSLTANIVGGSTRTYRFSIQNGYDMLFYDKSYNVYTKPNGVDSWTVIQAGGATTINQGSVTISVNTTSPTGNIASNATNVELAKFDFKATGEKVRISSLDVYYGGTAATVTNNGLDNVKLYVDGSQVGSTADLAAANVAAAGKAYSLGTNFEIEAGQTKTLTIKGDVRTSAAVALGANITLLVGLDAKAAGTAYAKALTSSQNIALGSATGRTLTVKTGTLSVAENTALGDKSATSPSGTVSASNVKIASFVITAGAGEAVDISQIVMQDASAATQMGDNFQNLKLKNGTTQLGDTYGTLSTSGTATTYTFNISPNIRIAAGAQYVVDVYADILSGAADAGGAVLNPVILVDSISATGVNTATDAGLTAQALSLQNGYVAASGKLNITADADTTVAQQIVMGATSQEVAKFKIAANASEDITITEMTVSSAIGSAATGTLQNLKLYVDGAQTGPTVNFGTTATTTYANAVFSGLSLTIPKNGNKVVTVMADVTTADEGAVSGGTHTLALLVDKGSAAESITAKGASSGVAVTGTSLTYASSGTADSDQTGNAMTVYRTKVSAAWAGDTPTGASVGGSAQIIAKINITNSANAGNQTATVKYVNLALSTTISNNNTRALTVYKDNLSTTALGTTSWLAAENRNFSDSQFTDVMTDVEIAAGATKLFLFTLDTTDGNTSGDFSLSVNMAAGDIAWDDGAGATITSVNSLPLVAKTLTY